MVAHIGKPFELEDLVTTLQAYAGRPHRGATTVAGEPPRPASLSEPILHEAQAQQIDLPRALSRLGGRQDVYLNLLRSFMQDLDEAEQHAERHAERAVQVGGGQRPQVDVVRIEPGAVIAQQRGDLRQVLGL